MSHSLYYSLFLYREKGETVVENYLFQVVPYIQLILGCRVLKNFLLGSPKEIIFGIFCSVNVDFAGSGGNFKILTS